MGFLPHRNRQIWRSKTSLGFTSGASARSLAPGDDKRGCFSCFSLRSKKRKMGSGGPQGGFDIHNFFKTSSSAPATPPSYNPNPFPPQSTYSFPPQQGGAPGMYSYMHYPQQEQHIPRPSSSSYAFPPPVQSFSQAQPAASSPSVSSPPLDGARLMALLTTQSSGDLSSTNPSSLELPPPVVSVDGSEPPPAISPALPTAPPVSLAMPSSNSKVPKGRMLSGEHVTYDIDAHLPNEAQPQLPASPITVYTSEVAFVLGRQIAVNNAYICYGLRGGNIRVLGINTGSRDLLKGHSEKVTDMVFSTEDVHTLASASLEAKVFIWDIREGPNEDGKNHISSETSVALQLSGDWGKTCHPCLCWWPPGTLVVGVGKYVLTLDISRLKASFQSEPIECPINKPADGVRVLGLHEQDVTALAAFGNRLASSSKDGTVRIWGDGQTTAVLAPHAGQPVNTLLFVDAPSRNRDQAVLLTAGPLSRELKLWTPYSVDGAGWKCIQTLELKSSGVESAEEAFFNQLLYIPEASLILIANARRPAIYVVHLGFGATAAATQMDYLAEFSLRMSILSFIATFDPIGNGTIQIYCVQGLAIQQYTLDAAVCKPDTYNSFSGSQPPKLSARIPVEKAVTPNASPTYDSIAVSTQHPQKMESPSYVKMKDVLQSEPSTDAELDKTCLRDASGAVDLPVPDVETEEQKAVPTSSKQHLITPQELMNLSARSKAAGEKEGKIVETTLNESPALNKSDTQSYEEERTSLKATIAEVTEVMIDRLEGTNGEEVEHPLEETSVDDADDRDRSLPLEDLSEQLKEVSSKAMDFSASVQLPAASKGRKNKNKASAVQASVASSSTALPEADSLNASQNEGLQEILSTSKELQKQMAAILAASAKESKRLEGNLGQKLEKIIRANADAIVARQQEENAKREKADRERMQLLMTSLNNVATSMTNFNSIAASIKDLPQTIERVIKKEVGAMGPAMAKLISPSLEKAVGAAVIDAVQTTVSDKTIQQFEKTAALKLETTVARQLQTQFQTAGRQALQESMRTSFEALVVPSFERSCRAMFEQVDAAFQKGMVEHISHAQQQASASHTALAVTLQDTVASVANVAHTMKTELADGQRKLLALMDTANARYPYPAKATGMPEKVLSLEHVEESLDPTIELRRLVSQGKLEEAFTKALSLSDVSVVSWLCNQMEPSAVFSTRPPRLSQGVLLSLLQQLGCDLGKDTARKLAWMRDAMLAVNPNDPVVAQHMRPVLDQVYQNLHRQARLTPDIDDLRLVVHVVNSLLTTCK